MISKNRLQARKNNYKVQVGTRNSDPSDDEDDLELPDEMNYDLEELPESYSKNVVSSSKNAKLQSAN